MAVQQPNHHYMLELAASVRPTTHGSLPLADRVSGYVKREISLAVGYSLMAAIELSETLRTRKIRQLASQ